MTVISMVILQHEIYDMLHTVPLRLITDHKYAFVIWNYAFAHLSVQGIVCAR